MSTLHQTPDSDETPQVITPYFRRCERFDREAARFAAAIGLPPERWPA